MSFKVSMKDSIDSQILDNLWFSSVPPQNTKQTHEPQPNQNQAIESTNPFDPDVDTEGEIFS